MTSKRLISGENKPKRKNEVMNCEWKQKIFSKYEKGARITNIAAEYCIMKCKYATTVKNKEAIKGADVVTVVKIQLK